jgi:hypothetical protein
MGQNYLESGKSVNHEELISISDFCITTSIREGFGMVYLEPWLAGTPVIGRNLPSVTKDLEAYGIEFPRLYSAIIVESGSRRTDFKDLEHGDQKLLIQEIVRHKSSGMRLISNNSFLSGFLDDVPADTILNNQRIVQERFSLEKNGKEIIEIYNEVFSESVEMKPVPTLLKPFIRVDPAIKAFVFDVYGTILVSASGDIDESVISTEIFRKLSRIALKC